MLNAGYIEPSDTPMPPPDPREQRVLRLPVRPDYPETDETREAAKAQLHRDRAAVIAELDDTNRSDNARFTIDALCDEFGVERVHRWVRSAGLIRGGICPCLPAGGGQ